MRPNAFLPRSPHFYARIHARAVRTVKESTKGNGPVPTSVEGTAGIRSNMYGLVFSSFEYALGDIYKAGVIGDRR